MVRSLLFGAALVLILCGATGMDGKGAYCHTPLQGAARPVVAMSSSLFPLPSSPWTGTWQLDAERSTAVDPWRNLTVVIAEDGDAVVLERRWQGSREGGATVDRVRVVPGGAPATVTLDQWPDNRHLGAYLTGDSTKTVVARWADGGRTLVTESWLTVSVQQGTKDLRIYSEYRLTPDGDRLDLLELRSTRTRPLHYVFSRATD